MCPPCPADSPRAAAPLPLQPGRSRSAPPSAFLGAEDGQHRAQADGLAWSGFSIIIVSIRSSTKFCGACASAPGAASSAGLVLAGEKGGNAGNGGGRGAGGRRRVLERRGVLGTALTVCPGVRDRASVLQIGAGMGAGERCDTGTPGNSLNLCRRRNKGDTGDSQLRGSDS